MNVSRPKAYTIPGGDAMPAATPTPLHLAPVGDKTVALDFDGGRLSSDAGLVLLKDPDEQLGLTRALTAVLSAPRDARRVHFTRHDLLKQRVFQIAAGYDDANDATTLRHDPIFKLLLDRLPETGAPWASQPTLSRFENRVSRTELYRMARVLVEQFLASYPRPPQVIVLDVDDTEDRVHGQQEQARYDSYDGGYCFLPLHLYEGLSGRLITTILKAKRFTGAQMLAVLKRLVKLLRQAWPDTLIVFRGDSHFAYPEVMQWIEAQAHLHYVTGLTSNKGIFAPLCFPKIDPLVAQRVQSDHFMPRRGQSSRSSVKGEVPRAPAGLTPRQHRRMPARPQTRRAPRRHQNGLNPHNHSVVVDQTIDHRAALGRVATAPGGSDADGRACAGHYGWSPSALW
jgi:Transposase DDE domain group 1